MLDSYVLNRKQKYYNNWTGRNDVTSTLRLLLSPRNHKVYGLDIETDSVLRPIRRALASRPLP